ncbi:MAG: hypothetical protein RL367_2203 [Pseudomonadota bacterium]
MTRQPTQLDGLTGLRGIAAWAVVIYHIRSGAGGWMPHLVERIFARGFLAVDLFFMLSGFVIWLNYATWFETRGWRGYGGFLQKRLARIWPLHALVLIAMTALAALLAATGRATPIDYPWGQLPLHFALLQNWGFTTELSWNHPAWSISTEFAAYLAFPVLVLIARPQKWPLPVLIAGVIGLALILGLIVTKVEGGVTGSHIPQLGLSRCLFQFAMGALVCLIWQRTMASASRTSLIAALLFALVGGFWAFGPLRQPLGFPLAMAPLLLALAHSDGGRWNPLRSRPLVWLGEISYSTYLIHFLGWRVFKLVLVSDAAAVSPLQTGMFMGLVLAGSVISYRLVEQPGRRWMAGLQFNKGLRTKAA